jgi:hypothetical protein
LLKLLQKLESLFNGTLGKWQTDPVNLELKDPKVKPYLAKPDGSLRLLADLREVNKVIKRKPYPLPKISDRLQKLEGFMYAASLDLNMGYYHMILTPSQADYAQ